MCFIKNVLKFKVSRPLQLYVNFSTNFKIITVEICSLRYPTRFALIAHLKYPGLKQREEVKKASSKCVVLCPCAGNTLLLSAKSMFCQWVNNGRRVVHQGQHAF
jgi:hypothetical protein